MHFSIADFLSDVLQNSIEAKSTLIELDIEQSLTNFAVKLRDNGCGMNPDQLVRALDPFVSDGVKHPHRRQGLGLPFLKQAVDSLGGQMKISSVPGQGTQLSFKLPLGHIDCPPLGDLLGTLVSACAFEGAYELVVRRKNCHNEWCAQRTELREALGDLDTVASLGLLRDYFESLEECDGKDDT